MTYKLFKLNGEFIKESFEIPYKFTGFITNNISGVERWFLNGQRHRLDGPAIKDIHNNESWYIDDKLHRIGGAALSNNKGEKQYYCYGKSYSKIKHDLLCDIMKLKGII